LYHKRRDGGEACGSFVILGKSARSVIVRSEATKQSLWDCHARLRWARNDKGRDCHARLRRARIYGYRFL